MRSRNIIFSVSALKLLKKPVLICVNQCLNLFCLTTYHSTVVKNSLQIALFMQNKPNFGKAHNELNSIPEKDLRKIFTPPDGEKQTQSKPNQTQFKPNFELEAKRRSLRGCLLGTTNRRPIFQARPQAERRPSKLARRV